MNIIEKLGIESIERFNWAGIKPSKLHNFVGVDPVRLTELEQQRNELFENTFDLCEEFCQMCIRLNPQHENCPSCDDLEYWRKPLVDMTGKSWQEIRELFKWTITK